MPINQYVPATIYTLLGVATPSILRIVSPCDGWITEFFVRCNVGPVTTSAIFDINIEGVTIFADPNDRPTIIAGGIEVVAVIDPVAVSKGDVITVDLDTFGSAPIGNPLDLRLTIKEGATQQSIQHTTASLANDANEDFTLALGYGFIIEKVMIDFKSWVRAYNTPSYKTADSGRLITAAPAGEHGCILDIYFDDAANLTIDIANARFGTDLQGTRDGNISFSLINKSGGATAITITVYYLEIEL